jgi:hypothetical protein
VAPWSACAAPSHSSRALPLPRTPHTPARGCFRPWTSSGATSACGTRPPCARLLERQRGPSPPPWRWLPPTCPGARPHRRHPVTSRTHRCASVHKEWQSCRGTQRSAHSAAMRIAGRASMCALPPCPAGRRGRTEAGARRLHLSREEAGSSGAPPGAFSGGRSSAILTGGGRYADAPRRADHRASRLDAWASVCSVPQSPGHKAAPAGRTASGAPAPPLPRVCGAPGAAPRRHQQRRASPPRAPRGPPGLA